MVRVEPNVDELPTDNTETRMTALKIEGRTLMLAFWIAITKGDAFMSMNDVRCGFVYGTRRLMRNRETM